MDVEVTLLNVLRSEFGDVASSCEVGNCGTCKLKIGMLGSVFAKFLESHEQPMSHSFV
jgi:ferredoxin